MSKELRDLFNKLVDENINIFNLKKIACLISKSSKSEETVALADSYFSECLLVDVNQLEALVNPNKYDFPDPDIGLIGVEK
jgi:hypothetical protein